MSYCGISPAGVDEICDRVRVLVEMKAPTVQGSDPPAAAKTSSFSPPFLSLLLLLLLLLSAAVLTLLSPARRAFMKKDLPDLAGPQMVIRFKGFREGKNLFSAVGASFVRDTHSVPFRCDDEPARAAAVDFFISSNLIEVSSFGVLVMVKEECTHKGATKNLLVQRTGSFKRSFRRRSSDVSPHEITGRLTSIMPCDVAVVSNRSV